MTSFDAAAMQKVTRLPSKGVAIEINARYRIPSVKFIKLAGRPELSLLSPTTVTESWGI
jgi:hypothetical protein